MTTGNRDSDNTLPDAPDPYHYIPLPEHERAFSALRDALGCGMDRIVLLGPTGFGKTLLLRRLHADPPPASRVFYLPFANLGAEELAPWLLSWMGTKSGPLSDDEFVVWARVEHRLGRRCILLLDEAQTLPREAAKRLDDWVSRSQGALQIVLGGIEGPDLDAVLDEFRTAPHRVGLRKALCGEALRTFADALVKRGLGDHGDASQWLWEEQELLRITEGVPRVVKGELRKRLEAAATKQGKRSSPPLRAAQQVALPVGDLPATLPPSKSQLRTASTNNAKAALRTPPPSLPTKRRRWWPAAALLLLVGLLLWPSVRGPAVVTPAAVSTPAQVAAENKVELHINAFPWAEIRIDGDPVGITPLAGLEIYAGPHELIAVFPDGRELIKRVDLRAPSTSVTFP